MGAAWGAGLRGRARTTASSGAVRAGCFSAVSRATVPYLRSAAQIQFPRGSQQAASHHTCCSASHLARAGLSAALACALPLATNSVGLAVRVLGKLAATFAAGDDNKMWQK